MSTIDDAAEIIGRYVHQDFAEDAARDLAAEGHLAPAPQIIHTVEELEALDGPVWVTCRDGIPIADGQLLRFIREYGPRHYLPAVVVATAAQVRAAREALDGSHAAR